MVPQPQLYLSKLVLRESGDKFYVSSPIELQTEKS